MKHINQVHIGGDNPEQIVTYSPATALMAEGARIGLVTCNTCGASILLDERHYESATDRHTQWHRSLPNGDT